MRFTARAYGRFTVACLAVGVIPAVVFCETASMAALVVPSRETLERHDVLVDGDLPWQRGLRLLQSLWRQDRGLPAGWHPRGGGPSARRLGSRLALPAAEDGLTNYLTDTVREVVRDELAAAAGSGKLYGTPRIYDDLLSSQPLCFNLFGELAADLDLATRFARHLWPDRVEQATRVAFEHSPGRDDERYLGNRTAFDVYFEHTTPEGHRGFIGIEVKYHERLDTAAAENRGRPTEVARGSGVFTSDALDALDEPPLQQLWFDHLLALSMLAGDGSQWRGGGLFVLLHPAANEACYHVAAAYQRHLRDRRTFQRLTLEEAVAVLRLAGAGSWVDELAGRYLDYQRLRKA